MIVGLDLAGVETRPTGYATLTATTIETCLIYTDNEILQKILAAKPKIVAVDAPLWLPPKRKNLEEPNGPHFRASDRELLKRGIKVFPPTLGPMRKLTYRGIRLRETLEAAGLRVIEVYPGGAQDALGIPRKKQGTQKLAEGLTRLGLKGLDGGLSDHELDAATAAYVGTLYLEGKTVTYGEPLKGIVMPQT
jgi:predicted nuclease with RNAse H fold